MVTSRREFLTGLTAGTMATALLSRTSWAQVPTAKLGSAVLGDFALAGPIFVGIEKGYFRDNGVSAEFVPFRGGPDLLKAVLAGEIFIGVTGSTDILVFREAGAAIRMVATVTDGNHFTLNAAPGVTKIADLKGKAIGVTRVGATTWIFARMLAQQQGWDPERDVRIVALGGMDAQLAALSRGEIAAFVWGDGGGLVEVQGKGKVLLRLDTVTPKWISQIAYTTEENIRKNPDLVRRCLRSMAQAMRFMKEQVDEAARIGAKHLKWPEEAVKLAQRIAGPLYSLDGRIDPVALEAMQETLLSMGILKKKLPLADHYTTEFTPIRL
jgi:NitT/TauT family transport system substrate-binding protein